MKQQAGNVDARVARERVAKIAVLPARVRLDDQNAQFLFADRNWGSSRVVVLGVFRRYGQRNVERQRVVTDFFRLPKDCIVGAIPWQQLELLSLPRRRPKYAKPPLPAIFARE